MSELKSKFTKKVSPLIEGQVPDFVQADHPVFVDFVKDYFQFLEAGKLSISGNIDYSNIYSVRFFIFKWLYSFNTRCFCCIFYRRSL